VAVNERHLPFVLINLQVGVQVNPFVLKSCHLHILEIKFGGTGRFLADVFIEFETVHLGGVVFVVGDSSAEVLVKVVEKVSIEIIRLGECLIASSSDNSIPDVLRNHVNEELILGHGRE
jgi:hypothetical protein